MARRILLRASVVGGALLLLFPACGAARYQIVQKDDVVIDRDLGLMWQRTCDKSGKGFAAARAYCDGLTLAGHDDWRLPGRSDWTNWAAVAATPVNTGGAYSPQWDREAFPDDPGKAPQLIEGSHTIGISKVKSPLDMSYYWGVLAGGEAVPLRLNTSNNLVQLTVEDPTSEIDTKLRVRCVRTHDPSEFGVFR